MNSDLSACLHTEGASDFFTQPPLSVLYQDEHIVAIDKPPGLLVHRSPIDKKETRFAVQTLRDQLGKHVFPAHRLDRPTSGVLLFTFDGKTAAKLGEQMGHSSRSLRTSAPRLSAQCGAPELCWHGDRV